MQVTIDALLQCDRAYTRMETHQFQLYILLKGRIAEFRKVCGERIKTAQDKIADLNAEYCVYDDNNNVVMETPLQLVGVEKTGRPPQPKMKEGKTHEEFYKALGEIVNQVVTMNL